MFFGDKLKISDNKTGFIIMMDMKQQLSRVHVDSLKAREVCVPSVKSVKNLGTWIDGNSRLKKNAPKKQFVTAADLLGQS